MIFSVQKHQGHVTIEAGVLMSARLKDLTKLVYKRKERMLVELSKERLDGEFQLFMLVNKILKIEDELWQVSSMRDLGRWSDWNHQKSLFSEYC